MPAGRESWATRLRRLDDLDRTRSLPPEEAARAERDALDWHTCPIGEHRAALEARWYVFDADGSPRARRLAELGHQFAAAIAEEYWGDAQEILADIVDFAAGRESGE